MTCARQQFFRVNFTYLYRVVSPQTSYGSCVVAMHHDLHNRTASNLPGFRSNFSLGLRWAMSMFEWDKESFEARQSFRNGDHQYQ